MKRLHRLSPVDRARLETTAETAWYVLLAAVCLVVAVTAASATLAATPRYCATCHSPQSARVATGSGNALPHRDVSCDRCHLTPTVAGAISNRVAVAGMLPAWFIGRRAQPGSGSPVANARCLACHKDILAKVVVGSRIRMSHVEVEDAKYGCVGCHPEAGHPGEGQAAVGYAMDTCLACHATSSVNVDTCDPCHVNQQGDARREPPLPTPFRVAHGMQWRHTHGMGDLKTCRACHRTSFCASCHKVELPHAPQFVKTHGQETLARKNRSADCLTCHMKDACDSCHGVAMPHPASFLAQHKDITTAVGEAVCYRCHERAACPDCHRRHIHPGIPVDVLTKLKARPVR